jgi:uncharacterized DUF497 family protein
MRFEWDEAKREANIRKHRIDFVTVERVLAGETVSYLDERFEYGETRFVTLGLLDGNVVVVVHTMSEDVIRVISVRKAIKDEEETYFKEITD